MEFQSYFSKTKIYVDYQQMTVNIVCYTLFLNHLSAFKRHSKSVTAFFLNSSDIKGEKIIIRGGGNVKGGPERPERKRWATNCPTWVGGSYSPNVENTFKVQLLLEVTVKILFSSSSCSLHICFTEKEKMFIMVSNESLRHQCLKCLLISPPTDVRLTVGKATALDVSIQDLVCQADVCKLRTNERMKETVCGWT